MSEGIIILSITVFYCVVNFDAIRSAKRIKKPDAAEIVFFATVIGLNFIFCFLKHAGILDSYTVFAMYVVFAAAFNILYGNVNSNLLIYEAVSILAFFAFFVTGFRAFSVFFMPVSFIMLFLCSANFYRYLKSGDKGILLPFFTLLFFTLSFNFLFFENLINLQGRIFLILLLICLFSVEKDKNIAYSIEDEKLKRYISIILPLLLIQCFIAVLIFKNPIFL